ncbi:hypothetical protein CS542_03800 [Pedobacter sp. IW39]|nr:hypothetical protein CS542_03800 [Pedobacter sp. IW39]
MSECTTQVFVIRLVWEFRRMSCKCAIGIQRPEAGYQPAAFKLRTCTMTCQEPKIMNWHKYLADSRRR